MLAAAAIVLPYLAGRRPRKRPGDVIKGGAKMTDGDGVKVKGYTVRLAGLDAPEWNQPAKHRFGFWFNHGKRVKRALSRERAGRRVQVKVEGYERYGRLLGTVSCRGMDAGGMAGAVRPGDRLLRQPLPSGGARGEQREPEHVGLRPGDRSEGLAAVLGFSGVVDAAA